MFLTEKELKDAFWKSTTIKDELLNGSLNVLFEKVIQI